MTSLKRVRIGDCIEQVKIKCGIPNLTVFDVSGINKDKEFFTPTKQVGADTSDYKIVPPNCFACNLMHVGRDVVLPIAINRTNSNKIVSGAYTVFKFIDESNLLMDYFFIFLKSSEKDRFFWFHCDSSVRDGMDWEVFCNVELEVPSIDIQKKYVAIYEGLLENLRCYDSNVDDLKLVCDSFIEKLRREQSLEPIGNYISFRNEKNSDERIKLEQGINIQKEFINPQRGNSNLKGRKIVRHGDIAYCTQLNNENVAIAYREGPDCVVSSVYDVFYVNNEKELNPKYLLLWLNRYEFGRYVYWMSTGTSYEFLDYKNITSYKIPVPEITIQNAIVEIYETIQKRKAVREELKKRISTICPILIRGSILEAKGGDSNGD